MTDLTDYKRLVSDPTERALRKRVGDLSRDLSLYKSWAADAAAALEPWEDGHHLWCDSQPDFGEGPCNCFHGTARALLARLRAVEDSAT